MGKINVLPPLLSSRIAAGEVIERPESVLRELLDNALDAGATDILIDIEGGGIDRIKVIDNGSGISADDLAVIAQRHATSKIHEEDDLYNISTLGFRGEALYSIAAVTKLTISSFHQGTKEASTITIDNGRRGEVVRKGPVVGTQVTAEDLFLDIPARRAFLKRAQTEANVCKNLVVSRALAFPGVSFKFISDGAVKLSWERCGSLKERIMMLYRPLGIADADVMHLRTTDEEFSVDIIAGNSGIKRSDRREIRIYVNGRPVDEYSLQQAVTYGYGELLPGGSYPYACVFIADRPELTDFNIHPAKKEVKLRNIKDIHHAVTLLLKNGIERIIPEIKAAEQPEFFRMPDEQNEKFKPAGPSDFPNARESVRRPPEAPHGDWNGSSAFSEPSRAYGSRFSDEKAAGSHSDWLEKAKALKEERERRDAEQENARRMAQSEEPEVLGTPKEKIKYIGQAFNLFLICEYDGKLWLVDQHAAHERIIYDELLSQVTVQNLLVPITLELEPEVDKFLDEYSYVYSKLGIVLAKKDGVWQIIAMPSVAREIEATVVDFISNTTGDEKELETKIFAILACKKAIKAGDEIDRWSAEAILEKVFEMPEPACPHGRTFLISLEEKELRKMVGRTE